MMNWSIKCAISSSTFHLSFSLKKRNNTSIHSSLYSTKIEKLFTKSFPKWFEYLLIIFFYGNSLKSLVECELTLLILFWKNFDAVVGDTNIIGNRSLYVDFTLPYTELWVSTIVPTRNSKSQSVLVFLKRLTWGFWVTMHCPFIFIGSLLWR